MRKILKTILATALSISLLSANTVMSFAANTYTDSPSEVSVPVTATVDSYYIVTIPSSTGLQMKKMNLTTYGAMVGDTNSTFYSDCVIGVKGQLASNVSVGCTITCEDMTTGGTTPTTAPIYMHKDNSAFTSWLFTSEFLDATEAEVPGAIAAKMLEVEGRALTIADYTVGTTGLSTSFSEINPTSNTYQSFALRTVLPKDGSYSSAIELDFSLDTASNS